jgi:TupA-like ATPgrasp
MSNITWVKPLMPGWALPVARRTYWLLRGRYPRRLSEAVLTIRARNPQTFHEKILYKMAHDRDPALTVYADKVNVRDFVRDRVGASVLTDLFGVFDSPEEIPKESLPTNFVIKPNHGYSALLICWEGNHPQARIDKDPAVSTWHQFLVHPRNLDWDVVMRLARRWLTLNYAYIMGPQLPEWAYRGIRPRLLVEEVLLDPHGQLPQDYKFFMFGGECKMIQVDSSRFDGHRRDLFDPNWQKLSARYGYPPSENPPPRPEVLDEMLRLAQALSKDTDFIRVDLYVTAKGIKFGELTNYPTGGMLTFEPRSFDVWLGADWMPTY